LKKITATIAATVLLLGMGTVAQADNPSKRLVLDNFVKYSAELRTSMQKEIRSFVKENSKYGYLKCIGYTANTPGSTAVTPLAEQRAKTACDFALGIDSELNVYNSKGVRDSDRGSEVRRVVLILDKKVDIYVTYDPFFGSVERPFDKRTLGTDTSVILPKAERLGFEFTGWYTKKGRYVGTEGDKFTPTHSITLVAQWVMPVEQCLQPAGGQIVPMAPYCQVD
jgi:uncharacterized repeat protein (TIGR02543 family)